MNKNQFIETFIQAVDGNMYKYVDFHDFSLGMELLSPDEVRQIAEDLYDDVQLVWPKQKENKELLEKAKKIIWSMKLSMQAHPDHEPRSEFWDMVVNAQNFLEECKHKSND